MNTYSHANPLCFFLILLLSLFFLSCESDSKQVAMILQAAENVMEQNPDSALVLLDSISNPYELNKRQHANYILLLVQAKDKAYKDIASDTVIFNVRDYYIRKNDLEQIALSSFYCGRVLHEQGKSKAAMAEYMKAGEYAERTKNINLRGLSQSLTGEVLLNELLQANAIKHFKTAAQYFHEAQNIKNEIISYNLTGNAFLMESLNDSALYYYHKGLELAKANNEKSQIAIIIQCIGVAYRETGRYDLADEYLRNVAEYTISEDDKIRLYLNLSKTFYGREMMDSAKVYVDKSLSLLPDCNDVYVTANIYKTLSQIAEKQSGFKQSLEYFKEYAVNLEKIVNENKNKEILELQKKYNYERLQNENNRLEISKQRLITFFSIVLLIMVLLALFLYKRFADNKKLALIRENQILEAEKKIYQLREMAAGYNSEINSFRNVLLHHFNILKKVSLLKQNLRNDDEQSHRFLKKFNEIVYGQESLNWDILYQDMNTIHKGLLNRLKERLPELDENEFRICCLIYADFNSAETGIILGFSTTTIQVKRSAIRKKLGIEQQENMQTYLKTLLES